MNIQTCFQCLKTFKNIFECSQTKQNEMKQNKTKHDMDIWWIYDIQYIPHIFSI